MQRLRNSIILVLVLFCTNLAFGQSQHSEERQEHTSMFSGWEAVATAQVIVNPEESHTDFASELHLTYWFTHKWALGVGYTFIFEEDAPVGNEVAALLSHKPYKFLTVNAGPSFAIPNSHTDFELSGYLETEWAVQVGAFHTGPTLGILVGREFRYFTGLHISYEF